MSIFWGVGKKQDPLKKLEVICRDTGDIRGFNKWMGKHKDIDLNAVLLGNKHPLHLACSKGFVDLVTCMVQLHGVAADYVDKTNSCTALHYAVSGGSAPTVEFLVERCGLNVSAVAENGYTPVHFACGEGHWRLVHYILACGAAYEHSKVDGCTGLMLCAQAGQLETVKYLIERKICNVNEADFGVNTALHFAAVEGHTDIVRYLLTCPGVNPSLRNAEGLMAVDICPVPALIALMHRMSHSVILSEAGVPAVVLAPVPQKRISFQKRPFIDDTISELSTDPFENADFERRRPSMMSQRNSGVSLSSLLMEEMLKAEQQFDVNVTKITKLISEYAGLPISRAEREVDLMLTWASDRANTVEDAEAHSSIMAAVIRRRSYRLSTRSSIGLSLDAKALRELLLVKSESPSMASLPVTPSNKSSERSPLNQTMTRQKQFFPDSPRHTPGRTPPPLSSHGAHMIIEGQFESGSIDSADLEEKPHISEEAQVDTPDRLYDPDMSRLLDASIQSIHKVVKSASGERFDAMSNTDSDAVSGKPHPAVDPYICGEEARMLWPGTHTPATSPVPSDGDNESKERDLETGNIAKQNFSRAPLLPPPFLPSAEEFLELGPDEVVMDHDGLPVLPWGTGERLSPRVSPRTVLKSPRSSSPRGDIDDINNFLNNSEAAVKSKSNIDGSADVDGANQGSSARRPSYKIAPILSPIVRRHDSPITTRIGNDLDSEEITPVRSSPRPSVRRMSPRSEELSGSLSHLADQPNRASPRMSISTNSTSPTSPSFSGRNDAVPEINLLSLRYVEEDSDEEIALRSDSKVPAAPPADTPLHETPLQQIHRKAKAILANSRSNERARINLSELSDSGTKVITSPINSTPSHSRRTKEESAQNEAASDDPDVFTSSQWEYLSNLLEKAIEDEGGKGQSLVRSEAVEMNSNTSDNGTPAANTRIQNNGLSSLAEEIVRVKQQEMVIKAGHKLAVKILAKYIQRLRIDVNIELLANAWGKLLKNARRPKKFEDDEEEVDEWTLRYKKFSQSRKGANLGLGLRLSTGMPQNYAGKPEPKRSTSVDRGLRRSRGKSPNAFGIAPDRKLRVEKSPATTPIATPRTVDDTDVSLDLKPNFRKTFLAPLWIPPPDYELEAPVMPLSASGKRSPRLWGFSKGDIAGSPRASAMGSPRAGFSFGESPRGEKKNPFNENNILASPDTPSHMKSLRNPIKQEEEELRRQLLLHHQLHAQASSSSLLGDDNDGADTASAVSSVVPPPLDWSQIDLITLGAMPDQIVPTFKANEGVLWRLYCAYVLSQDGLSASARSLAQSSKGRRLTQVMTCRRMLGFDVLWNMLRDFEVCPTQCSKKTLLTFCQDIMEASSSRSGGGSSGSFDRGDDDDVLNTAASLLIKRPWDEKKNKMCFVDYKKVLWRVARDCVKSSAYAHPSMRLCKLFRMMDSGGGRAKLSRSSRSSVLLPAFVLFEASASGVPSTAFSPPTPPTPHDSKRQSWPMNSPDAPITAANLFASLRAEKEAESMIKTGNGQTEVDAKRSSSPGKGRMTNAVASDQINDSVNSVSTSSIAVREELTSKPTTTNIPAGPVQKLTKSNPANRSERFASPEPVKPAVAPASRTAAVRAQLIKSPNIGREQQKSARK